MITWYPEFTCLVAILLFLVSLTLWNKFGSQLIQFFSTEKRR
jgi:hypothetical protein